MNWLWGDKKPDPVKESEVETINIAVLKKDTKVSVTAELEINHPIGEGVINPLAEAKIKFVLPEGYHIQSCRVSSIDVLS